MWLLTGCKEEIDDREPSPDYTGNGCIFTFDETKVYLELDPTQGITMYNIPVSRSNTKQSEFNIIVKEKDSAFEVPAKVTFTGENLSSLLTISFNLKAAQGVEHKLSLAVNDYNPYLDDDDLQRFVCNMSLFFIPWSDVKTGILVGNVVDAFFDIGADEGLPFSADYKTAKMPDGTTKLRILNPYCSVATDYYNQDYGIYNGFPVNDGSEFTPGEEHNIDFTISEDNMVSFKTTNLGIDYGYGNFYITMSKGGEVAFDSETESFSFEPGAIGVAMANYNSGAFYLSATEFSFYLDPDKYCASHPVTPAP